jgi:hypothetical protein
MLIDRGFVRVRPLLGGLDAWVAAGYAIAAIESEAARHA